MTYMMCRSRVKDYSVWREIFDSHKQAHIEAGLTLTGVWRGSKDPNNIFFIFEVEDMDRAEAFINDPISVQAGEQAGVIDGEYHYAEDAPGY